MTAHAIRVTDDVLPDPAVYRAGALAQPFGDFHSGAAVFHGLAPIGHSPLAAWLETTYGLTPTWETFRLSPEGQVEPSHVHQDLQMGTWTGLLYLNPDPPAGDGTDFFRYRETGAIQSTASTPDEKLAEWAAWRDATRWDCWHHVPARFNRLVVFPAAYFHGRALFENYGTDAATARLIQLCFGTGVLPWV